MGSKPNEFSRARNFFWPVHRSELQKLIPMLLIFFFLNFDYNILRCMKDTLIITAEHSGAEVIPFIKVWGMFPMSLIMTYIYIRLSNRYSSDKVFYAVFSIFLIYFFAFAFIFYPMRDELHAHASADAFQKILPVGLKGLVAMYRYWIFTTFYIMAELWGNIVIFVLFWGFANQVTKFDQAKRFYGLFGIGTNFSGIAAGQISLIISTFIPAQLSTGKDAWGYSMNVLLGVVLVVGLLTMGLFYWLNKIVLKGNSQQTSENKEEPQKKKLSMRENFRFLARSRYVFLLAAIILSYNVVINLVEVLWKQELRELHPDPLDYNAYMNKITTITGILATFVSLFISGNVIRKCGWTFTALITPMILFITSIGFFGFFFLKSSPELVKGLFGFAPLTLVVFFGSLQNCMSRAAKYSVFDATKEIAFVPLPSNEKIQGKAAIDGVCNRLGKSSGAVIYQALLLVFSTVTACVPYVAASLFLMLGIWVTSVKMLGKKFQKLVNGEEKQPYSEVVKDTANPEVSTATALA